LILASFLTLGYVWFRIHKVYPYLSEKSEAINEKDKKRIASFFGYFTFASIATVLFANIDNVMIGSLIDDVSAVGLYNAAFALSSSLAGLFLFSSVLLPFFIELKKDRLERAFNKVLRYSMILAIPGVFGLVSLANYIVVLIYGYSFIDSRTPLIVLAFMIVLSLYVSLITRLFLAKEKPKDYLGLLAVVIVLNVFLNYFLIKYLSTYSLVWGITGAGIATTGSWLVYAIGMFFLVEKKLKIRVENKVIVKPLVSSVIMALVIYYLKIGFGEIGLLSGALLVSSGIVVYLACMLVIGGIKREDLLLVKELFGKR
jgi:O-antigen/teichoic acid export membrane protein